jgi:hypothetical protein
MAELMDVIPTVIGGVVALKLIDYALPDKKTRTVYVTKKIKHKKIVKHKHHKAHKKLHKIV